MPAKKVWPPGAHWPTDCFEKGNSVVRLESQDQRAVVVSIHTDHDLLAVRDPDIGLEGARNVDRDEGTGRRERERPELDPLASGQHEPTDLPVSYTHLTLPTSD